MSDKTRRFTGVVAVATGFLLLALATPHYASTPVMRTSHSHDSELNAAGHEPALSSIARSWTKGDFTASRAGLNRIASPSTRQQVLELIQWGEAAASATMGDVLGADRAARHLRAGVKQALLLIQIGHRYSAAGAQAKAAEALESALQDANAVQRNHRIPLLVMISRVYFSVNPDRASAIADAAIHASFATAPELGLTARAVSAHERTSVEFSGHRFYEAVTTDGWTQIFVLRTEEALDPDLQHLMLAEHGRIRCTHQTNISARVSPRAGDQI